MSQVIVTDDHFKAKRNKSYQQEHKITVFKSKSHWQKSDATKQLPQEKVIGYLVLPIVLLWALLGICGGFMLGVVSKLFNVLGKIFVK